MLDQQKRVDGRKGGGGRKEKGERRKEEGGRRKEEEGAERGPVSIISYTPAVTELGSKSQVAPTNLGHTPRGDHF
jgi:hypothetical protein